MLELHGSMSYLHHLEILDMAKVRRCLRKERPLMQSCTRAVVAKDWQGPVLPWLLGKHIPGFHNQKNLKIAPGDSAAQ